MIYRNILLLLTSIMSTVATMAQDTSDDPARADSVVQAVTSQLPIMSEHFYSSSTGMQYDFNYDLVNRKRRYMAMGKTLYMTGYILSLGGMFGLEWIAISKDWNTMSAIGLGFVGFSFGTPFMIWGSRMSRKGKAINTSTAYIVTVGQRAAIGPALFVDNTQPAAHAIGVGFCTSF